MKYVLVVLLLLGALYGRAQQWYAFAHPQMGTEFRIVFFSEKDSLAAAALAQQAFRYVDTLNQIFSDYIPDSDLNLLSDQAGTGKKVLVKPELYEILQLSQQYANASGGAFDVTVGALTRLWRKARHLRQAPDSASVQKALGTVGYPFVRLHRKQKVRLVLRGTRLDLGGIAQGYAADKCLEILRQNGVHQALVDAGGDIAVGASPPNAAGWAIQRPVRNAEGVTTYETLWLTHCGITTSGATYRYLEANGVRYSHIVDPRTGWGMTHGHLVTVHAHTAVAADAWATALSVQDWALVQQKKARKMGVLNVWQVRN